ncbi:MAG: translational GTPase TypA [SAR202 cluster bacterium]|nr:translational GTPase TypA [SAR202 cluster bacterium]MQG39304.1 translational GTPase TypA [SAR202 cluster bacterium]|tara:strand:+ start:28180 stop:30024 length:1845 start_codon:yes stop_codon:yes gene_type:complete
MKSIYKNNIRNIAIIAHVDHGKTTLVDSMLKFSNVFDPRDNPGQLIMDSNPQERERGITILAKHTSINFNDVKINIIDTPGHVDFSGEIQRTINMADGCLLVVDAFDGPMPQTRYVLAEALKNGLHTVVVINKIDRDSANISNTIESIQDLFLDLATEEKQLDFPIVYSSAVQGYSIKNLNDPKVDMKPLFETIIENIPPPNANQNANLQMLTTALDYDNHLGSIAIGRVFNGTLHKSMHATLIGQNNEVKEFQIDKLFTFSNLRRQETDHVIAGDIAAISGTNDFAIGDTISSIDNPKPLNRISIEKPTVKMTFGVNTSPFAGQDGKHATSRILWNRLVDELKTNVSLKIEKTSHPDEFFVSGRGELHLSVLIENMRREKLEFQVSKPNVITHTKNNILYEPYELLTIDTKNEYIGPLTEELSKRLATLVDIKNDDNNDSIRHIYQIPTRGLIGLRNFFLRITRGNGFMNTEIIEPKPLKGELKTSRSGAIISTETGTATAYSIRSIQEHGELFISPQTLVYEGMIIGKQNKPSDLNVNVCKEKKLTNQRSSTSDIVEHINIHVEFSLDESLSFISNDELIEVTPKVFRIRKKILKSNQREKELKNKSKNSNF